MFIGLLVPPPIPPSLPSLMTEGVGATSSGACSHFKREEHLQIRTTLRQGSCINYLHKWNFKLTDRLALVRKRANGGWGGEMGRKINKGNSRRG